MAPRSNCTQTGAPLPSPLVPMRSQDQRRPLFLTAGKLCWWLPTASDTVVCHQLRPLWACLSILHSTPARGRGEGNAFGGTGKVERGEEPHLGPSITQCTGVKGEKPAIWSWYPGLTVWPQAACRAFLWCASSFPKMKNEGAKIFFSALSTRHLFLLHLWVIFYHIYYECLKASLPTGDSEDKNQIYLKSPFIPNIVIDT